MNANVEYVKIQKAIVEAIWHMEEQGVIAIEDSERAFLVRCWGSWRKWEQETVKNLKSFVDSHKINQ